MIYMENKLKGKFYWLLLQQDLLGTWCIKKIHGGLHNNYRKEEIIPFEDRKSAAVAITDIEYIKRQRGYTYSEVDPEDLNHFKVMSPKTSRKKL